MGILDLKNVAYSFGNGDFIRDLSMSLDGGEFVGLIGANGSGKSTILKLSAGILKKRVGEIALWGRPLDSLRSKDRAKLISYLPQTLDMNIPFTVRELVSMGRYPYDILPDLSPDEALAMVGLGDKAHAPIAELSGGERRRAYIGMTLQQGAGILLLDEPLANLDLKFQIETIRLLKRLRDDKGMSIIMALHDINLAFEFDRVCVVREGKYIASGPPHSIITGELLRDAFGVHVRVHHHGLAGISFSYD